jgi:hypothetical protein
MSVFEYFILIGIIPNYSTCFHIILKIKSIKHIKNFTILIHFFTLKHEKPSIGYSCYASFICECTLERLEKPSNLQIVCKWLKSNYGLHQSSQAWYQCHDMYLLSKSFQRIASNPNICVKHTLIEKLKLSLLFMLMMG